MRCIGLVGVEFCLDLEGGYQVLHRWLKGRKLSFDDIFHYQKVVVALKETLRLMEDIVSLIPAWPIE